MGRAAMVDVHEIEDRALERRPTIVGRSIVFVDEIGPWLQHTYERLVVTVPAAGGSFCGPPFARFTPLGGSGSVEVEAGFPVMAHVPVDDDLVPAHLPGGPAAVTWHTGPYESPGDRLPRPVELAAPPRRAPQRRGVGGVPPAGARRSDGRAGPHRAGAAVPAGLTAQAFRQVQAVR
ncbi:MAG: hypothetical protein R2690_06680 [Acidimicrobiales bacterium]